MAAEEIDFSTRLHELRGAELRRLPSGAREVLHGGAAERWYFEWFDENYPGQVHRHVGVEAFAEHPDDLPPNVEWLKRTLGDMAPVADESIDMVYAGQVIEHLWADDVAGFLSESRRVLRPNGLIALDSTNRRVTEAIGWHHPQHTVEFTVDEIATMVALAGFEAVELRGVLLGYDRERHRFLQLEDEGMPWEERARLAAARPEDSFVWWMLARRTEAKCDEGALRELAAQRMDAFRARRLQLPVTSLPVRRRHDEATCVSAPADFTGALLQGPNFPLDAGSWRASLLLRLEQVDATGELPLLSIEVVSEGASHPHARRDVLTSDLAAVGVWTSVPLDFTLERMVMGLQLRVSAHGRAALGAQTALAISRPGDAPVPDRQAIEQRGVPEPKTVAMVGMLARRASTKALAALGR